MAFIGAFTPIMRYFDAKSSGFDLPLDTCIFAYALLMVIVSSVFCSLYLGTEYNDGIIRNKLVVGHSRFAVYFSNLIVCSVSTILFQLAYLVVALPIGLPLLGLDMKVGFLLFMFFCILIMSLAYVAIFTIIGMLCQNKAVVAVICVLGTFIMLFVGIFITSKLSEPEFHEAYEYVNDAGEIEYVESEKNPYYLGGTKRKIYSVVSSEKESRPECVDLRRVLEESLLSFYGAFMEKGIEPVISLAEDPVKRLLDPVSLSRIFGNIISNAVKYSDGDFRVHMDGDGTAFFSNTARGLDAVSVGRLFDRFYTLETGRNSTGLGLSIARLLTERMGGTVKADYKEHQLLITVTFPE